MATLASLSPHLILHRFICRSAAVPCFRAALLSQAKKPFTLLRTAPSLTCSRFISSSRSAPQKFASDVAFLENVHTEADGEIDAVSASSVSEDLENSNSRAIKTPPPLQPPPPSLSVKEKKELASYAHSLGKKLKSWQVGKSGVTDTVVGALIETLEANELLKLKIHGTCPGEIEDVVKIIEETTGSVVVGQIGRTVILYRPSLSKLKAEEKKKLLQKEFLKRKQYPQSRRPAAQPQQEARQPGRGRRGVSRY
ncbi:hypothetical protein C2S52_011335 [Perilla frutescens var. hirtella]|nr:hypothetical protein C2S52_011335 [Perilla frutescens var. hirtella]